MRTARIATILLVGAGLITYSGWLLEFVVPTGVSPVRDPVDALLAGPLVFRIMHAVSGVAFLLAGPPLRRIAPVQWQSWLGAMSVSAFGALVLAYAVVPGNVVLPLLLNAVFVVGAASLVLWWPPGWHRIAVIGLVLVLATWLASMLGEFEGVFTRLQMVVRVALLGAGAGYVLLASASRPSKLGLRAAEQQTPRPRAAKREGASDRSNDS
ncbi:hypothetical protein [Amycolatopsis sp. NPDC051128]|uniref:hypothetical protein n=1 Tax=Amycolatopsis sp. NPDC051128 TaxID=3155412 RepID=UPI00343E3F06